MFHAPMPVCLSVIKKMKVKDKENEREKEKIN